MTGAGAGVAIMGSGVASSADPAMATPPTNPKARSEVARSFIMFPNMFPNILGTLIVPLFLPEIN
jgi:hypothetical protein